MDRRVNRLLRWLTLPLLLMGLSLPPGVGVRAAELSLSGEPSSVTIVFRDPGHGGVLVASQSSRRKTSRREGCAAGVSAIERISMVLGPAAPDAGDIQVKPADRVTIELSEPCSSQAARGPSAPMPPGAVAIGRTPNAPLTRPELGQRTETGGDATAGVDLELALEPLPPEEPPAAIARPAIGPLAQSEPEERPETGGDATAEIDLELTLRPLAPEEPPAVIARPAIGRLGQSEPEERPETGGDATAGIDVELSLGPLTPEEPPAAIARPTIGPLAQSEPEERPETVGDATAETVLELTLRSLAPEQPPAVIARPTIGPLAQSEPEEWPEIGRDPTAGTDLELTLGPLAPEQPSAVIARPTIGPLAQSEPGERPEIGRDPTAGTDLDPAPEPLATEEPPAAMAGGPQPFGDPAAGSLLLPPETATRRSEQLEQIARQADRQIRRGFELAGRKAYFAARSRFIGALRLVVQGLDTEHHTNIHSRALAAGLTALKEADDFFPTASRLEADLDIPAIVEGHRTPVLKNCDTETLTALLAMKCYVTFAQEQLAVAAGSEVAGSMALHAMGKLYGVFSQHGVGGVRAAEPKAVAFYQAALLTYPQNYMAANDLGVLLARCGDCREAEAALKYSLSIHPQAAGWRNLAVVYRQLGQIALARRADQLSESALRAEIARRKALSRPSQHPVRWMDPATFARSRTGTATADSPRFTRARTAKAVEPSRPSVAPRRSSMGWLPGSVQEKRK